MKNTKSLLCNIISAHPLTDKVIQLMIEPSNKRQRFNYLSGQYLKLILPNQPEMPFSIANAPLGSKQIELHIRHTAENHYSHVLLDHIKQTGQLHISGPFGESTWQRVTAKNPIILLAGGTGFAPIKAIIEQALTEECTLPMHLYWVAKTRSDLYLDELPASWAHHMPQFKYTPILSTPDATWQGETGRIYDAVKKDYQDLASFQVFAAGPYDMVKAAWQTLATIGLKKEKIYSDILP